MQEIKIHRDYDVDDQILIQDEIYGDEYITKGDRKQIKFIGYRTHWDCFDLVVEIDGRRARAISDYFEMEG